MFNTRWSIPAFLPDYAIRECNDIIPLSANLRPEFTYSTSFPAGAAFRVCTYITKRSRAMKESCIYVTLTLLSLLFLMPSAGGGTSDAFSSFVDEKGSITLPSDYRTRWAYLGSWVVPDGKVSGYGFHNVYTQPASVEAYRKTGEFPDGTIIIKEIRKIESARMTTGRARYAGDAIQWFVMVRDRKGRFPDNPNWGEGWGWARFEDPDKINSASRGYKNCLGCHIDAKKTDWLFIKGYPALK